MNAPKVFYTPECLTLITTVESSNFHHLDMAFSMIMIIFLKNLELMLTL